MREKEVEAPSTEQGRTGVESNIYRPWLWASLLGWGNGVLHSYVIMWGHTLLYVKRTFQRPLSR